MVSLRYLGLLALGGAIAALLGCGAADPALPPTTATGGDHAEPGTEYEDLRHELSAVIPDGWQAIRKRISAVTEPQQILAAASYRLDLGDAPRAGCLPRAALRQMPLDGALLQVIEYTPRRTVSELPPRPESLRYSDGAFGPFECAGPSHQFSFNDRGRSIQAQVWFSRDRVDPATRSEALQLIDSLELGRLSRADLQACEEPRGEVTGYNWRASVAGVSCERVGRFIQEHVFSPEVSRAIGSEAEFAADDFDCSSRRLTSETGWRVSCVSDQAQFVFDWTP